MTRALSHKEAIKIGAKGGRNGTGKSKARDPEKMRQAALKRWEPVKFLKQVVQLTGFNTYKKKK